MIKKKKYRALKISLKHKECYNNNIIKIIFNDNDFSYINLDNVILYNEIVLNFKVATKQGLFYLNELMNDKIIFDHHFSEDLNFLINNKVIGKCICLINEEKNISRIKITDLLTNYQDIINDIDLDFYVLNINGKYFLSQENRILFKIEVYDKENNLFILLTLN